MIWHDPGCMNLYPIFGRRAVPIVVALACIGSAHGAEKVRPAAVPAKTSDRILTPAQLRECVLQREQLRGQTDTAVKAKAEIAVDKAEIDRTGTAMAEALAALDRTSADAVAAHNAKVDERSALIKAYEDKVDAFNRRAELIQTSRDGYDKACENRRYDDRDLTDLQRKK